MNNVVKFLDAFFTILGVILMIAGVALVLSQVIAGWAPGVVYGIAMFFAGRYAYNVANEHVPSQRRLSK